MAANQKTAKPSTPHLEDPRGEKPKFKFPKAIGACADRLFTVREERLAIQRMVDKLAEEETAIKQHIIDNLPKSEASGVAGRLARVSVVSREVPQVKDWPKFYAHIKKTGDFDLLNRALSKSAIEARWEAGKEIAGVEHFTVVTVSMNKL